MRKRRSPARLAGSWMPSRISDEASDGAATVTPEAPLTNSRSGENTNELTTAFGRSSGSRFTSV
jgi:hypothetical protein